MLSSPCGCNCSQGMPDNTKHLALVIVNLRPGRDGASSTMLELMFAVRRLGFRASIFNFVADEPSYRDLVLARMTLSGAPAVLPDAEVYHYRERGVDCQVHFLPYAIPELATNRQEAVKTIMQTLRGQGIDYALTADRMSLLAAHLLGLPGCHFLRSLGNVERLRNMHPAYLGSLRSRDCTAGSTFLQGKIKEWLGIDATVINPVIDFDTYVVAPDVPGDAVGFYALGTARHKGDELVHEITRRMPETKFVVVGRGYHRFDPLPANVTYMGYQPDMKEFYRKIKLILVPSLVEEGFSRMILEAAANGIPAIANNVGGIPEALGDSGVLIPIESLDTVDLDHTAECYVREIKRLMDNKNDYVVLRAKARQRARNHAEEQEIMLRRFFNRYGQ